MSGDEAWLCDASHTLVFDAACLFCYTPAEVAGQSAFCRVMKRRCAAQVRIALTVFPLIYVQAICILVLVTLRPPLGRVASF
jgi:hypothetical protein